MRDPDSGNSKGYAFINFASFEASDAAIEAMNGQYLCNRAITISYAFKKDSKGERHGSAAGTVFIVMFSVMTFFAIAPMVLWLVYSSRVWLFLIYSLTKNS
jgi:RNA recognition motif-containing protein